MSRPGLSPYRRFFDNLPATFKEDLTIIHRGPNTRDGYNLPDEFNEANYPMVGRFEITDGPDREAQEGGIRDTTLARCFIKELPFNWIEDFVTDGAQLSPRIWRHAQMAGSVVQDGRFNSQPVVAGPAVSLSSDDKFLGGTLEVSFEKISDYAVQNFGFWILIGSDIYEITATNVTNGAWYTFTVRTPSGTESTNVINSDTNVTLRIVWNAEDGTAQLYVNDVLGATHDVFVPDVEMEVRYQCIPVGGAPLVYVDEFKVTEAPGLGSWMFPENEIQIEARDKRWAVMDSVHETHLQTEFNLQEVIP